MSSPHSTIEHILQQADEFRAQRSGIRPVWVTSFINRVAELFEPITGVGRVGFECSVADGRWHVGMYLGSTEVVGGRNDGLTRPADFEIDLLQLIEAFCVIERFRWIALPSDITRRDTPVSRLSVVGKVDEHSISLTIHSVPPGSTGPGFREYPDGRQKAI